MSSPEPDFRPRPLSHRTWLRLGVIAVLVAVAYVVVAYAYDAQGSLQATSDAGSDPVAGLDVTMEPTEVNAVTNQATMRLTFKATSTRASRTARGSPRTFAWTCSRQAVTRSTGSRPAR